MGNSLEGLTLYLEHEEFPPSLQRRIQRDFQRQIKGHEKRFETLFDQTINEDRERQLDAAKSKVDEGCMGKNEGIILGALSPELRAEASWHLWRRCLCYCPIFQVNIHCLCLRCSSPYRRSLVVPTRLDLSASVQTRSFLVFLIFMCRR